MKENRKIPGLTFIIPLNMTFTIALDYKTSEDFKNIIRNKDGDTSKVLRSFVFKRMKVEDIQEFNNIMFHTLDKGRQEIYLKLGVDRKNSFSSMILRDIQKYIKDNET